jgi:rhomboid-like protein
MQVLQDLQYRRVTGSLAGQGISFPGNADITPEHAERGLNWLRENYPVDEEMAAAVWAEEEAANLEAQYTQRAEELWLYKKNGDEPEVQQIQQHDEGGLYGHSVLEQRRKEVKARKEAEEAEAQKALEAGDAPPPPYKGHDLIVKEKAELGIFALIYYFGQVKCILTYNTDERKQRRAEETARYYAEAELPSEQILATRSAFSRLWQPFLFGLTIITISAIFAESYEPPARSMRIFPDIPPAVTTCAAIAIVNTVIWIVWKRPEMWRSMNRYFLLSAGHPNAFSVVGGTFSHQRLGHLASSMAYLFCVGIPRTSLSSFFTLSRSCQQVSGRIYIYTDTTIQFMKN